MRLLTFMQIAQGKTEISFDAVEQELQLDASEVESFIIDGLSVYSVVLIHCLFNGQCFVFVSPRCLGIAIVLNLNL